MTTKYTDPKDVPARRLRHPDAEMNTETQMYFSYDPECGLETHNTLDEAKDAAEGALAYYREEAGDGWPEEVENVCYGEIKGATYKCDEKPASSR
jgi:hypothetical protein